MLRSVRICLFGTFIIFADPSIAIERSCTSYIQLIYGMNKDKAISELSSLEGVFKVNKTFREKVLKASLDKDSRELMTESIIGSMRKRSKKLSDRMKDKNSNEFDEVSQVHDIFIVGAGLQSSILAQGIKQTNKDIKTMVVEETDMVASTFAMSPNYFRINSSNRAENFAKEAVPGSGNLNRSSGGSVQIPDFEANKYPRAGAMSDIALYNLFESEAEVMFKTRFVKTEKRGPSDDWPAKYRITIRRGDVEYYQYANKIINATGLGKEKYGVSDEKSLEFIQRELLKGLETTADSTSVPKIMSFNETRRLNELMDSPYSPYVGKKVMVVGNGDSGKVTIEHLFREGPEDGYKKDKAQNGLISKLIWAGQKEQDCDEYVTTNRVRYAGISAAYKNGTLKPVESKVVKYEEELGGVKVTFEDGRVEFVDHVIISTGFEKEYGEGYRQFVGDEAPANLEKADNVLVDVKGRIKEARDGDFTTVGVQLTNTDGQKEDIYFAGPMINLIREGEEGLQAGVSQNSVSKFINGPRNYTLASLIAENTAPIGAKRLSDDSEGVLTLPTRERRVSYKLGDDVSAAKVTGYNEKFVLANFLSTLENFNLDSFKNNSLDINITLKDGELVFSLFDGGSEEFAQIVSEVLADKKTRSILKQVVVDEGDDLNARIAINDKGEIVYDESKIVRAFRSGNYLDVEYRADPTKYEDQAQSMTDILKENMQRSFSKLDSISLNKKVLRKDLLSRFFKYIKTSPVERRDTQSLKLFVVKYSDSSFGIEIELPSGGKLIVDEKTKAILANIRIDDIKSFKIVELPNADNFSTQYEDRFLVELNDGSLISFSVQNRMDRYTIIGYTDLDSEFYSGYSKIKVGSQFLSSNDSVSKSKQSISPENGSQNISVVKGSGNTLQYRGLVDSSGLSYDLKISFLKDNRISLTLATDEGAIRPVDDSVSEILKDKSVSDLKNIYVVRAATGEDYIRFIYNDESFDSFFVSKDRDNENVDTLFEYSSALSNDTVRQNGKLIFSR